MQAAGLQGMEETPEGGERRKRRLWKDPYPWSLGYLEDWAKKPFKEKILFPGIWIEKAVI
jgi:hypothetical protein